MNRFKSLISAVVFCITPGGFGMPEQVANDNPGEIVERVRNILDNTRNIRRIPERRNVNTKLVVLLGATGSGKTSLLHILAGSRMNVKMLAFAGRRFMVPDEDKARTVGRVAGGGNAVTSDVHPFPIENVVYCDGPGLFDTNGGFAEMGNNLIMNEILKEGSKILWVVSIDEILAMRGGAANRSLDYLLSLLPERRTSEAEKKAESIGIVMSKGFWDGRVEDGLRSLREQEGHHWLIDYLQDHVGTNAFWFPAPREEGVYEPPQDLVEKITNFANTRSSLIYGSMGLQPGVIDKITEKRVRDHFNVEVKVGDIVKRVKNDFDIHKENLDKLLELEGAFSTLWSSLAVEMTNQPGQQDELQRRWRRRGSDPMKKFNFTLRNFVGVLDGIEYFRNLCKVGDGGFNSKFENGLLWEELVDCISRLPNPQNRRDNWLRILGYAGGSWKKALPGLMRNSNKISNKIKELKRTRAQKIGAVVGGAAGTAAGAVVGGVLLGAPAAAAIGAAGASLGAGLVTVGVKGANAIKDITAKLAENDQLE